MGDHASNDDVMRTKRIGVNFFLRYYQAAIEKPETIMSFYGPNAFAVHGTTRASSAATIERLCRQTFASSMPSPVKVKILDMASRRGVSGTIVLEVKGELTTSTTGEPKPYTQVVELREYKALHFSIVSDKLTYVSSHAPNATMQWALGTPPMFASKAEEVPPMERLHPSTTEVEKAAKKIEKHVEVVPVKEEAAPAAAKEVAAEKKKQHTEPLVSAAPVEPAKPKSFAECLRLKNSGAAANVEVVRVTAPSTKTEAAAEKNAATKEASNNNNNNAADAGRKPERRAADEKRREKVEEGEAEANHGERKKEHTRGGAARGAAKTIVFYDVIVKGLAADATSDSVKELLACPSDMRVKLVKVDSRESQKNPKDIRTCAFVQLDHDALKKENKELKAAVANFIAHVKQQNASLQVEEVREKRFAAAAAAATTAAAAE